MKKTLILGAILFSLSANAQSVYSNSEGHESYPPSSKSKIIDTTIQITFTLNEYKAVMNAIDSNIDSKKISKEILEFIAKNAQLIADKPKNIK